MNPKQLSQTEIEQHTDEIIIRMYESGTKFAQLLNYDVFFSAEESHLLK